jgi:RNA polymerase sigma-70 factor (ECF subfamily)
VSVEPAGLLKLLETHGPELHALFTRLTLRAGVAEDLLQDLFLKLQKSDGLARAANPRAYLFRAAMHLAFDWRRAQRRMEPLDSDPAARMPLPLDTLVDAEELELVLAALDHLSEGSREVVVRHYLQHQEYAEIAADMGKTEHQVRGLCSRGLDQLRTVLRTKERRTKS